MLDISKIKAKLSPVELNWGLAELGKITSNNYPIKNITDSGLSQFVG